ncbi:MAG: tetratricopeptide repeat protein, partial [Bacteroidia bacterium]
MRLAVKYLFLFSLLLGGVQSLFSQSRRDQDSLLKLIDTAPSDSLKAELYGELALRSLNTGPEISKYYIDKALKYMSPRNENFKASCLLVRAAVFRNTGLLDSVALLINQAMSIANKNNNKPLLAKCYMELGLTSQTQNNPDRALEFYAKCLAIQKVVHNDLAVAGVLNNIGILYTMKEDWKTALEYFNKSLQADLKNNLVNSLGNDYNNLGVVFIINKQYDSATVYLNKGLQYRRANNDMLGIGGSMNNMALLKMHMKQPKEGLVFVDSALKVAQQIKSKKLELEAYGTYHEIYSYMKDFEKALRAYTKYNELQRQLTKESGQQKIEQMQKSMELELKEKQLLEKDFALMKSEKDQEKKNYLILLFLIGTLALSGFIIYIFKINKKLKNVNLIISEQKNLIQEKHKDITDSINYAQKIQTALIVSDKVLQKKAGNIFVLFRPRDVVSGDFYWFSEKDGKKLLAVADCTGHGVPGAFMSMIGITILNQIVNEKGITSPAEILNRLREGVINSLNQTGDETGKRDGMDVALIA